MCSPPRLPAGQDGSPGRPERSQALVREPGHVPGVANVLRNDFRRSAQPFPILSDQADDRRRRLARSMAFTAVGQFGYFGDCKLLILMERCPSKRERMGGGRHDCRPPPVTPAFRHARTAYGLPQVDVALERSRASPRARSKVDGGETDRERSTRRSTSWLPEAAHSIMVRSPVVGSKPTHTCLYDAFPLEIDQHGASARTAQALPALRRGATVFRMVAFRPLFNLRLGLRTPILVIRGPSPSSAIGCQLAP